MRDGTGSRVPAATILSTAVSGLDRLEGGAGNDTYTIDSASEVLVEVSGIDLVRSTVTKTLATGFENLTLLGTVEPLTGNDHPPTSHRQRREQHPQRRCGERRAQRRPR